MKDIILKLLNTVLDDPLEYAAGCAVVLLIGGPVLVAIVIAICTMIIEVAK